MKFKIQISNKSTATCRFFLFCWCLNAVTPTACQLTNMVVVDLLTLNGIKNKTIEPYILEDLIDV